MIKPFLTNKGQMNGLEIILKCDNETVTESSVLAEMLNSHCVRDESHISIFVCNAS